MWYVASSTNETRDQRVTRAAHACRYVQLTQEILHGVDLKTRGHERAGVETARPIGARLPCSKPHY